jgi:hypothetical protein
LIKNNLLIPTMVAVGADLCLWRLPFVTCLVDTVSTSGNVSSSSSTPVRLIVGRGTLWLWHFHFFIINATIIFILRFGERF